MGPIEARGTFPPPPTDTDTHTHTREGGREGGIRRHNPTPHPRTRGVLFPRGRGREERRDRTSSLVLPLPHEGGPVPPPPLARGARGKRREVRFRHVHPPFRADPVCAPTPWPRPWGTSAGQWCGNRGFVVVVPTRTERKGGGRTEGWSPGRVGVVGNRIGRGRRRKPKPTPRWKRSMARPRTSTAAGMDTSSSDPTKQPRRTHRERKSTTSTPGGAK